MANPLANNNITFGSNFSAYSGEVVADITDTMGSLFSGGQDSVLGQLKALGTAPTSASEVSVTSLSQGSLSLEIPNEISSAVDTISASIRPLIESLEQLRVVLGSLKTVLTASTNAIQALLQTVFTIIEEILESFTSVDCSVRVLPVPPIHPVTTRAASYTLADGAAASAFAALMSGAYRSSEESQEFLSEAEVASISGKLLSSSSISSTYGSGSDGFTSAIKGSFSDKLDPNRPVEPRGYSAGMLIKAGAPTASIFEVWSKIESIFLGIEKVSKETPRANVYPAVRILATEQVGFSENGSPQVRLTYENPFANSAKNVMELPNEVYFPAKLEFMGVENTSGSRSTSTQEAGFVNLDTFSSYSPKLETTSLNTNVPLVVSASSYEPPAKLSALSILSYVYQRSSIEVTIQNQWLASEGTRPTNFMFKSVTTHVKYSRSEDGSYALVPGKYYLSVGNTKTTYLNLDVNRDIFPVRTEGLLPNWIQYGGTWAIPGLSKMLSGLTDFSDFLQSYVQTSSSLLEGVLASLTFQVTRLTSIAVKLQNISYSLQKFLEFDVGASYYTFLSDSGATGVQKAMVDFLDSERGRYLTLKNSGADTSGVAWFDSGESVCGIAIVATSESLEKVKQLISIIELLLNGGSTDVSGQGLLGQAPSVTLDPILPEDASVAHGLFSTSFVGIPSERHTESPENAC